ncbi:MAG TPA: amino acid ABC transporter substrate-binding protein [Microbacteriaceae bacterium]|nr:amino acid ABC transporter substrate-binding protein [Microbacteriaceae bacterium]
MIGASISQTGDFSSDGEAVQRGYELWAEHVNASGGLLGRQVKLKFVNDASSTQQVVTNYQNLISREHVDLTFGPFSSLLVIPSSNVASRFRYAFVEPAGGSKAVFNRGLKNVFEAQPTAGDSNFNSFAEWLLSLPANQRPRTAAYATENDPFIEPEVEHLRLKLQAAGIKTVYNKVYPVETTDYTPIGLAVAQSKADVVALGTEVPDAVSFIKTFIQQGYNPKAAIFANGPDQGSTFSSKVGINNTSGLITAVGWLPTLQTTDNQKFLQAYLKKYGGSAAAISGDSPEAYSVGQIIQQAVESTHSIDNQKLIQALHSMTFQTVQGPLSYNAAGEPQGKTFLGQWVKGKFVAVYPSEKAEAQPLYPKPTWGSH